MSHTSQKTTQPMKAFTTDTALALLWKKASPELHLHELEWFANGAAEQVATDSRALAGVLENVACLVHADDDQTGTGSFRDSSGAANLLFDLKTRLDTLAGLADIAADAGFMARSAWKDGAK
jgi:hypothetical protein